MVCRWCGIPTSALLIFCDQPISPFYKIPTTRCFATLAALLIRSAAKAAAANTALGKSFLFSFAIRNHRLIKLFMYIIMLLCLFIFVFFCYINHILTIYFMLSNSRIMWPLRESSIFVIAIKRFQLFLKSIWFICIDSMCCVKHITKQNKRRVERQIFVLYADLLYFWSCFVICVDLLVLSHHGLPLRGYSSETNSRNGMRYR